MGTDEGHPTTLFARYMQIVAKYWAFVLSVVTATWSAATRLIGDMKNRWETQRLRSELEKRRKSLAELGPSDPALQSADDAVRQAQGALESHEKRVAAAKAERNPLDKMRVGIGTAVILLAVFAASGESDKKSQSHPNSAKSAATTDANTSSGQPRKIVDSAILSEMENRYTALVNQIRPGMSKEQVEDILGIADETKENDLGKFNPQKAGQILTMLTWKGDGNSKPSIILGFLNNRLSDGGTPGYDINKGFHGQLPPGMSSEEQAKLKKTLNGVGFQVDEN